MNLSCLQTHKLKRVILRFKGKQLQLILRPPQRPTSSLVWRRRAGFGPRFANARPAAASRAFEQTPDADIFTSASASDSRNEASVDLYSDEESHLHGISGSQRSASYSFVLIPDTDKGGRGVTRFFERKLPRHLSVSGTLLGCPLAPRGLLSPPLFPHKIAVCTAEWKITGFVLHRGRRRDVDVGGREGARREVKTGTLPPFLLHSCCWLGNLETPAQPLLQEWASQAPIWHLLLWKETEEETACWLAAPFTNASDGVLLLPGR